MITLAMSAYLLYAEKRMRHLCGTFGARRMVSRQIHNLKICGSIPQP